MTIGKFAQQVAPFLLRTILLFVLEPLASYAETCQDEQLSACIEECRIKCQNIEIRPFVNATGLLRVPFTECVNTCEEACQETDIALQRDLKTEKQPLAHFVLKNRAEKGCTLPKEQPSAWKRFWMRVLNWLFETLGLVDKTEVIVIEQATSSPSASPEGISSAYKAPVSLIPTASTLNRKLPHSFGIPAYAPLVKEREEKEWRLK